MMRPQFLKTVYFQLHNMKKGEEMCVCLLYMYISNVHTDVLIYTYVKYTYIYLCEGFPGGLVVKNLPANAGDTGLIPGSGRSPGEGNGNPLQCSCLGSPMDRGT
ncbi:unnamed protein product [Rangifer tarandus platyrhynchus]|uniref:Uncharacterized protein n=1 Tax=Rangifer tarandus platyrhynchus TaxID=3082113 RepID=A0AC59ZYE1_RANTA